MGHDEKLRAEAQVAEDGSDHEEQVFVVSCSAAKGKATKGWLIDSGCTNHMTPNAAIFKNIDRSFKTMVKVGNGHSIKAEGKGDVLIDTLTGIKLVSNVLFVPEIDRNLLSIAQLLKKGYLLRQCHTVVLDESKLWHKRLGHVNYNSLAKLTKEDLVENFTNSVEKEDVCETEADQNCPEMDIDHKLVRGTKSLSEIYERAEVVAIEPSYFEEVEAQQGWK
ncbi:uncharacterized protein LOC128032530 [Gossypium raimondii]|uniref:uncharacterized protein LOC128032530 n=1 Tax=Gossypium raimondii TaxID=29730 RepID=UPI00227C4EED|nr:uncharacterized protein LOC128032530 [Gossypium raimondii]